jgi:hypothetical protein
VVVADGFDIAELLSAEVRLELAALDAQERSSSRQTLAVLLGRWRRYAVWVSSARPVPLDDYQAMLFARDEIQRLIAIASLPTARLLDALVSPDDSVFLAGTTADDDGVFQGHGHGWWWRRLPKRLEMGGCSGV